MAADNSLADFHPVVRGWFTRTFGEPSPPQVLGWPSISSGSNTLILAPTGSGKTLAAFLWAINHLVEQHLREDLSPGVRILYVSPLKALNNDIERNLVGPLEGIREEARSAGLRLPAIRTAVRTGDTPQSKRASILRHPPDILITTPESLYLMLTSKQARKMFRTVQYLIVDEIHSVCSNKRGVHLSLSMERLQAIASQEMIRIGLSATQHPLERIGEFLAGQQWRDGNLSGRPMRIIDAGRKKEMDLRVICAATDFTLLPQETMWPLVFGELLEQIRAHRTTLIFVNNRRLAERVAANLNEMDAGASDRPEQAATSSATNLHAVPRRTGWSETAEAGTGSMLVQAYHGSMSRHARELMERDLKAGKLRALVATSSLELGIDIGSIDLVIQLQSPKGIARGLQRVGRSGHLITATSKGRLYPTHREDLVESAVVAEGMQQHEVESTIIPVNCLDVLAQQIVAMVSVDDWHVDALYDLVRQSSCYRTLPRKLFDSVIQMLAGRYTHEAFRELRPRLAWDRVNGMLRALPGSGHLAITSGGTIADRGYYPVILQDATTKLGEVDEEFIYESRVGDTFILGTSVWRISSIDANRITVTPAPGEPARMPFWRGEGIGRSFELGARVGAFRRLMDERIDRQDCLSWLQSRYPIDSRAAWNIQEYFRKQRESTGVIPHDRLVLVEGFRDEIGDPRICVHLPFGRSVNGLLGLVLARRLTTMIGVEPQMLYNDDGILFRCSDAGTLPLHLFDGITSASAEEVVLEDLPGSAVFGGHFRQNAARALLMPKAAPGKRTPLWLQRLRAGDLLQLARRFDDFPIVIETFREVLHDVLDFDNFTRIVRDIESGTIRVHTAETEYPSPFSASLLFDFIAVYMYGNDQPRADRTSQFLAVNREILGEIVGLDALPSLLRPEAISSVESRLQHTAEGYRARSPEELMEILIRVGDLSEEEVLQRCAGNGQSMLEQLARDGRAVRVQLPGGDRWIAGEEKDLYSDLGSGEHTSFIVQRFVQNHGIVTSSNISTRYGIPRAHAESLVGALASDGTIVHGRFRSQEAIPGGAVEWCYRPNLERIHRETIAILRKEITPSTLPEFTDFLLHWQHLSEPQRGSNEIALQDSLAQLQGVPLPAEIWEREILIRRIRGYSPDDLSRITSSGSIVWVGTGPGRMTCVLRGEGSTLFGPAPSPESFSDAGRRILRLLESRGALFFGDIRSASSMSLEALNKGIAELFWNGVITNDLFGELQRVKRTAPPADGNTLERVEMTAPYRNPARARIVQTARRAIRQVPGWEGRWSLVHAPGVYGEPLKQEEQASRQATLLLDRYGIVAREFYRREDLLPWPLLALEFQRMELRGDIRRGYFVKGLSGMQYALPEAVEELRRIKGERRADAGPVLVNACDPANPYGPGIDMAPELIRQPAARLSRSQGTYIAFVRGTPVLLLEHFGSRLWTMGDANSQHVMEALRLFIDMIRLPDPLRPFREVCIEQCDGIRPAQGKLEEALLRLGFYRDRNQTMRYDGYASTYSSLRTLKHP